MSAEREPFAGRYDDDRLTEYHQAFPCDVVGAWWNSYDPDPRAADPLSPEEVIAEYQDVGSP